MDPYKILGVSKTAKMDEIKGAYRKLAKKLHPDLNPGNKSVEDKFKEVNKAYELVGTEEARAKFDRGEHDQQAFQQGGPHYGFGGQGGPFEYYYQSQEEPGAKYSSTFSGGPGADIFEELFGSTGRKGGRRTRAGGPFESSQQSPGAEHYSMDVDFNTAALGGEREITLPTGKRLKVKIPGGISSGTKLRLQKQSSQGGDAYIEINVKPSKLFRRIGNDIEVDLPLAFNEAILGIEVRVPTVDGAVMLKVPSGVSTGSRIRIKGKGVAYSKGEKGHRGDEFAVVKIIIPPQIDDELKKIIEVWSQKHHFDPRKQFEGREDKHEAKKDL